MLGAVAKEGIESELATVLGDIEYGWNSQLPFVRQPHGLN